MSERMRSQRFMQTRDAMDHISHLCVVLCFSLLSIFSL